MERPEDPKSATHERRQSTRHPLQSRVRLTFDSGTFEGRAENVSHTDVLFFTEDRPPVTVEIEGETPPLRALMAWAKVTEVKSGLNRDMRPLDEAEAVIGDEEADSDDQEQTEKDDHGLGDRISSLVQNQVPQDPESRPEQGQGGLQLLGTLFSPVSRLPAREPGPASF